MPQLNSLGLQPPNVSAPRRRGFRSRTAHYQAAHRIKVPSDRELTDDQVEEMAHSGMMTCFSIRCPRPSTAPIHNSFERTFWVNEEGRQEPQDGSPSSSPGTVFRYSSPSHSQSREGTIELRSSSSFSSESNASRDCLGQGPAVVPLLVPCFPSVEIAHLVHLMNRFLSI